MVEEDNCAAPSGFDCFFNAYPGLTHLAGLFRAFGAWAWKIESDCPIFCFQFLDPGKGAIIRDQNGCGGQGVSGDHEVEIAKRLS